MSILSKFKKIEAQLNPFDGGATYSNPNPGARVDPSPLGIVQKLQPMPKSPMLPAMRVAPQRAAAPANPGAIAASYLNTRPTGRDVMSYLNIDPYNIQGGYMPQQASHVQVQSPRVNLQGGRYYSGLQVQPSYLNLQ